MKMKMKMKTKFSTPEDLRNMRKALEAFGLKAKESGSPSDPEGHVVSYRARRKGGKESVEVFFAMIHSSRKQYMVRHAEDLFQ